MSFGKVPAALSATGLMVITYYLGCILAGPSACLLSALMLATNFQFLNSARDSVMDMTFALFIGAVILLSYLAIIHKKPWYLVLSFLPGALAMLTKGPAGLAVPAAIMFAYLCITKELRRFIIPLVVGCVLSGALGSMWFLVAGDDYWREFILRQNFVRYTSAFDHKESLFYYFPKIFNNFLPWSIPLPFAVYGAFKKKLWLPLVWLVITFLFFEFSASKRAVYYPPLSCLRIAGLFVTGGRLFDHRPTHCLLRLCALLLIVTPCAFLTSLLISSQPILVAFRQDSTTYGAAAALTSVGIVLLFLLTKKRAASSLVALFVYFVVAGAFYHLLYLQVLDRTTKSPRLITESIRDSMPGGETATFGFDSPGVIFYLGKPVQTFYSSQAIKPAKSDIMLIVKDSFVTDAKRELEEHFVPIRTVMYREKTTPSIGTNMDNNPYISVLIPILNEEESLPQLQERLYSTLEGMGKPYEIIYINDGSTDRTEFILEGFHERFPTVKVIEFNWNYGQHMALFAGFQACRGSIIITIDGDLQNPPEEIPKLVTKMEEDTKWWLPTGRKTAKTRLSAKFASSIVNKSRHGSSGLNEGYGLMLEGLSSIQSSTISTCARIVELIPALQYFTKKIIEIEVAHEERKQGKTKYSLFRLLRLNFDLMTSFSLLPIQFIGVLGSIIAALGLGFAAFLIVRRLIVGPEVEGTFTLFGILFFFVGIQILALGIIGEYIGRIYLEVRKRPRFIVKKELL